MLSEQPTVDPSAKVVASSLGVWTQVAHDVKFYQSTLGDYSYIMQHSQVMQTQIGKFCSIASFVRLNPGNHPLERPTSHHMTYRAKQYGFSDSDDTEFFAWREAHPVHIGHDVWIGHNVTVLPGVTIGNGAAIGAGAIVTKDVAPYTVVAGVPAKPIKMRFDDATIDKLEAMRWWDWTRSELEERFADFRDMDRFLEKYALEQPSLEKQALEPHNLERSGQ
jgi:phosphonate metabolism protein (transferase hexapeptide repeat family)